MPLIAFRIFVVLEKKSLRSIMSKVFRHYGVFLLIPGIVLAFSFLLRLAAGPFWLATNFDPSYVYLINGLHILKMLLLTKCFTPVPRCRSCVAWSAGCSMPAVRSVRWRRMFLKPLSFSYYRLRKFILCLLFFHHWPWPYMSTEKQGTG